MMRTRQPEEKKEEKPAGGFERKEPAGKPSFTRSGKAPAKTGEAKPESSGGFGGFRSNAATKAPESKPADSGAGGFTRNTTQRKK